VFSLGEKGEGSGEWGGYGSLILISLDRNKMVEIMATKRVQMKEKAKISPYEPTE